MNQAENHSPPSPHPASDESRTMSVEPRLQREAIVMGNERGRLGLLVALCSLAGVVVGFGLSNMAAMRVQHCPAKMSSVQVASASLDTPTWLGVRIFNAHQGGAYVERVEPGSPAQAAGIKRGDVIVGISASHCPRRFSSVDSVMDLVSSVRDRDVGENVRIRLNRAGRQLTLGAELSQMPVPLYLEEIR